MKKTMKKALLLLLTLALCASVLAGCGGKTPETPEEVKGETYDAGDFTVLVPDGWKEFPVSDMFDEYDGDYDPTALQICKGGDSEWDLFSKPYVQINYYPDNTMYTDTKDFYNDTADLEPIQAGGYTWNGFTGTSLDTPMAVIWTTGDVQLQVTMSLGEDDPITATDADVLAILGSIVIK